MRNKEFEKAILDKVKRVLDGMEYQSDFLIRISLATDELPVIHYECTEFLAPYEFNNRKESDGK